MTPRVLASVVGLALVVSAAQPIPPTSFQHAWVKAHAIPIQSVKAETGFADLQPLKDGIGDARIVALGEATHGTREIYQLRHRLTEFLASEMGFSLIAIEALPESDRLNEYVLHGQGDPTTVLRDNWVVGTGETLNTIEWMRRFNASGNRRLRFADLDPPSVRVGAQIVENFLRRVDAGHGTEARRIFEEVQDLGGPPPTMVVMTAAVPLNAGTLGTVKFSGAVKTRELDGYAGLCWRVDGARGMLAFDRQADAPHGTNEWRRHEVVLEIPTGAVSVSLGVLMRGKGAAWFDDLRVQIDGRADADRAFDSDFESDRLDASFTAIEGYAVNLDKTTASRGNHSLQIEWQRRSGEVSAAEVGRKLSAVVAHMEKSRDAYLAKADARTVERAIRYARAVQHQVHWLSGEETRDETMAHQVRTMMEAAPSDARLVLWAHNEHVGRVRSGLGRMGARLADWYGAGYVPVGFALNRGEYLAVDPGTRNVRPHALKPAEPGSYEYEFARAGLPRFVLDLRGAEAGDGGSGWLRSPMLFRSIGAVASDEQFRSVNIGELFDLIVFLADTTPTSRMSRGGTPAE